MPAASVDPPFWRLKIRRVFVPIWRWGAPSALLAVALTLAFATSAAAETLRFKGVVEGGLSVTGNSLGLSKKTGVNEAGTEDSIGALIAGTGAVGDFPSGTTLDWTQDESGSWLVLPPGAEVVYAELVWGGSYDVGGENLLASLGSTVDLSKGGAGLAVAPDPDTAETVSITAEGGFQVREYMRSAEVTEFVAENGSGFYRAAGIPITKAAASNTLNSGGWALYVVYEAAAEPMRWVEFVAGGGFVEESDPYDYGFEDYCAPSGGSPSGRLRVSASEGDANRIGDQLLAGADPGTLTALSSANNLASNFFASQINLASGELDMEGTFGSRNHNPATATNVSAGRQGWDVGAAAVTGLADGQEGLHVRAATTGDTYMVNGLGFEGTVDAPEFTANAGSLGAGSLAVGESTTLTVPIQNTGVRTAEDVTFKLALPAGVELGGLSVGNVGVTTTREGLAGGIEVGDLAAGETRTVNVGLVATAAGSFQLAPSWDYGFTLCAGADQAEGSADGAVLTLTATGPAGPPVPPPGGGGPAVAAKLSFGKLTLNKARGTATLAVSVNGAGTLSTSGKGLVAFKRATSGAQTVKVAIKAKGSAKTVLSKTGKVKIDVSFKFQPQVGAAVTKKKAVVLKNSGVRG